jgi:uncharacterized protein (DUF1778 family)
MRAAMIEDLKLRLSAEEKAAFAVAAKRRGQSLSAFVREAAARAAGARP